MFEVCMALRIASRALAHVLVARRRRALRASLASSVRPAPVSASIAVVLGRSSRRRNTWTAGGHSTRRSRGRHCWRRRRFAFVAQSVELQRGRMIEVGLQLFVARGTLACVLIARRRRARRCYLACCIGPAPVSAGSAVVDGGSSRRCSTRLALVTKSFKLERSGMFEVCMALRIASRALARVLVARRRRARRCCLASGVRPAPVSASIAVVLGRSSRWCRTRLALVTKSFMRH